MSDISVSNISNLLETIGANPAVVSEIDKQVLNNVASKESINESNFSNLSLNE